MIQNEDNYFILEDDFIKLDGLFETHLKRHN